MVKGLPAKNWVNVCLPRRIIEEIDQIVEDKRKWSSRAEFVREAVRRQIEKESSQTPEEEA